MRRATESKDSHLLQLTKQIQTQQSHHRKYFFLIRFLYMGSTMNVAGFIYDSCLIQISDDKEWSQIIFTQHSFLFFFHTPSLLLCTCSRVTSSTSSSLSKRYMKICHTGAVRLHSSGSSLHQCQLNNCLPLITAQIRPR